MAQYNFGVGQLTLIPSGSNPTPINVGTLKDISLDISQDTKELYGANKFPEDVALGKAKITGKAKSGRIQAALIAAVLAGSTVTTGQKAGAYNELATIPATPYQVTVANSATFLEDQGVYDYTAGIWLTRVASAPATGQYSVAAGVYTFAAADTTHSLGFYYSYTVAASGKTVALTNQLMGAATTFVLTVFNTYGGKKSGYKLYATIFPKLSWADKQDDHRETDMDFSALADSQGRVIDVYTAE